MRRTTISHFAFRIHARLSSKIKGGGTPKGLTLPPISLRKR